MGNQERTKRYPMFRCRTCGEFVGDFDVVCAHEKWIHGTPLTPDGFDMRYEEVLA